jgi:hypothetical protein
MKTSPNSCRVGLVIALAGLTLAGVAQDSPKADPEAKAAAYAHTLDERATKIVATLGIADAGISNRVHAIIVKQYRDLSEIHESRDAQIAAVKQKARTEKTAANAAIESARATAQAKMDQLHPVYLKKLAGELTSEQVDQVKDGMTYGVAPKTYAVYLKMYPELTDAQKLQIKLFLHEARELAMDGSTSAEKHAVFGKYKGRINNYLSKAGYDAKQGERNLKKANQSGSDAKPQ